MPQDTATWGFLYLWKGQLDQAVECVLRALEVDPHHKDAPDHLFDVLRALTDELVQIGCTEGFLSTQPGGAFDDHNRHRRTREIGALIATIGQRGVFKVDGRAVESDLFMAHVINDVQKKMGHHSNSTALKFAWDGLGGWHPCVAVPLPHHMELRHGVQALVGGTSPCQPLPLSPSYRYRRSKIAATPWPPPTHMVSSP